VTPKRSEGALDGSGREWSQLDRVTGPAPGGAWLPAEGTPWSGGTARCRRDGSPGTAWPTGLSCGSYLHGGCPVRWQEEQVGMRIRRKDSLTTRERS
jgi:hypothetical protein